MSLQLINIGQAANDGTGDELRAAFQKININFLEIHPDCLIYDSIISQSESDAPTNIIIKNTIGNIIWAHDPINPGVFIGTLANAFTPNKSFYLQSQLLFMNPDDILCYTKVVFTSTSEFILYSGNTEGNFSDSLLQYFRFTLIILP